MHTSTAYGQHYKFKWIKTKKSMNCKKKRSVNYFPNKNFLQIGAHAMLCTYSRACMIHDVEEEGFLAPFLYCALVTRMFIVHACMQKGHHHLSALMIPYEMRCHFIHGRRGVGSRPATPNFSILLI